MSFSNVGIDLGHYANANAGPVGYYEGNVMLDFGLALAKKYDVFLTRTTGKNLDLKQRGLLAKGAGCDAMISFHTNAPVKATGIVIYYPKSRPQDKAIADALGKELSLATGIKYDGAFTRTFSDGRTDYYGIIRDGLKAGLRSVLIVEHGSHWEFSIDTQKKIDACVEVYGEIFGLRPKEMSFLDALEIIHSATGSNIAYWYARKDIDKWFEKHTIDIAKAIQRLKEV